MIRPQVMAAIIGLFILGMTVIFVAPDYISEVATGVITGIGMLAMKVIEDKN